MHEQNSDIITFEQFKEGNLAVNQRNVVEDQYISASIDESSTDNNSDDGYISTNALGDSRYGNYLHPDINAIYARLKIHEHIRKSKSEWK